jgi:hypothetical protein
MLAIPPLQGKRESIDDDDLPLLADVEIVRERILPERAACMYSISGRIGLRRYTRALRGGECMLVFGASPQACDRLAREGFDDTVQLIRAENPLAALDNAGILTASSGRRAVGLQGAPDALIYERGVLGDDLHSFIARRFGHDRALKVSSPPQPLIAQPALSPAPSSSPTPVDDEHL